METDTLNGVECITYKSAPQGSFLFFHYLTTQKPVSPL